MSTAHSHLRALRPLPLHGNLSLQVFMRLALSELTPKKTCFRVLRGWGEREGAEWVVREGVGAGGEMTQVLYAHMNNKK
jgi:hypothetical protein